MVSPSRCPPWQPERPGPTRREPRRAQRSYTTRRDTILRPGNVHSADGWREVLEPVVSRYRDRKLRRYFRADAAFASPEVYEFLEAEGFLYAIRLPANRGCCNRASLIYSDDRLADLRKK